MNMDTLPFDFAAENLPLAPLTLYNVGGPARLALIPRSFDEAVAAYEWIARQPGRKMVLGGGSNILIGDAGFDGIVLITTRLDRLEPLGNHRYRVESGVVLDRLVRDVMLAHNYDGVGGLTGIPGSVGGAIYMNAGTVNGSTCQLLESAEVITPDGLKLVPMHESLYSYRGQTFCPRGSLILRGTFRFTVAEKDQRAVYDHYIQRRREKQPQGHCCGSVFKNPPGDHAGRLIESCGLKGTRRGGAVISPLHANFIMNENGASSEDILALIDLCKRAVLEKHGIRLEEEVIIVR
jgi:UDP-N-acetylmuramate dehydrogenase